MKLTKVSPRNTCKISMLALIMAVLFGAQSADAVFCWKQSWGRGVGTVPLSCDPAAGLEKSGLLCYPTAKPGYTVIAGVGWQICPAGFRDDGAFCRDTYSRGALYISKSNCDNDHKDVGGCEWSYWAYYPKCKPGYVASSASICSRECPGDMTMSAGSCRKNTYVVAPITPSCEASKERDAGLCYKHCNPGEYGVGPVCYKKCPAGMVPCGLSEESSGACASSGAECVEKIFNMISSIGAVVYKVIDAALTGGSFSALTQMAKDALISNLKKALKNIAKEVAKMTLKEIKDAIKKANPKLTDSDAEALAKMQKNPEGFDYMGFLTKVDPTGLAAIAESFIHGLCP